MDTIINIIQPLFEKYQNETNVEFEMRLGKINNGRFDTDVGEQVFNQVLKGLEKYKEWEQVVKTNTSVYYKDQLRTSVNDDTDDTITIIKKKIVKKNLNLENQLFDMRFAISKEIPVESNADDEMECVRIKKRISFIRKNLSIDMTVVTGDPADMDCEDEARYEIELEIIDPTKVENRITLYNIVYKVFDVLKIYQAAQ